MVRGKREAEATLKKLEDFQGSLDQHQGWRYFIEKSGLKAGTDPAEATHLRQSDLEARETKALQESGSITKPSPFKQSFG